MCHKSTCGNREPCINAVAPWLLEHRRNPQIDGDALLRNAEAAVDQRRAYPVLALAHGGIGQAHHGEARQARTQMDFDAHRYGADPQGGTAV